MKEERLPIIDVEDVNVEFKKLMDGMELLQRRFMAVAMDYNHYIDNTWGQKQIYELRDHVTYRMSSARLHVELLLVQHVRIAQRLNEILRKDPKKLLNHVYPSNPIFDQCEEEVSSIFDSVLYHLTSVFDYTATLSNYVLGPGDKRTATLMWTQLAKGCRDPSNHFGQRPLAQVVTKVDRDFVGRMYDYRSYLIHQKSDRCLHMTTLSFGENEAKVTPRFAVSTKMIRHFSQLKELSASNRITIRYVTFWLLNRSLDYVTELLFAMKSDMENNRKVAFGMFGIAGPNGRLLPVSSAYWDEEAYLKKGSPGN